MKNSILLYCELLSLWLQIHRIDRIWLTEKELPRESPRFFWTVYVLHMIFIASLLLYFLPAHPMKIPTAISAAGTFTGYAMLDYLLRKSRRETA